jgi:ATP phosphoribosyltransferase regulatory subunit
VRLARAAPDFESLERELDESQALEPTDHERPEADELGALLDQTPAAQRDALLGRVLAAVGPEHFGVRSPEEIARRLLNQTEDLGPIEPAVVGAVRALLAIDAPLDEGLRQVRAIAADAGSAALTAVADGWDRRVELLGERGVAAGSVRLRPRMGRGINYYTGFVFEIHDGTGSGESQLCGGGRYDDLVESVGGTDPVPAVGFSLGLERVQLRLSGAAS